jgi:hypothetical protein
VFDTLNNMICVIVNVEIKFPKLKPVLLTGEISHKITLTKQVIVLGKKLLNCSTIKRSGRFIFLMKHKI